jgi:hypothetical protein
MDPREAELYRRTKLDADVKFLMKYDPMFNNNGYQLDRAAREMAMSRWVNPHSLQKHIW